ncbi:hypothetical protein BH11PSE14_BH11PSE14_15840 [soil metagenome]
MSEAIWYYVDATGARVGPVAAQSVRDALEGHVASRSTMAWREGLADWRPVSELAEELGLAAEPPPIGASAASYARAVQPPGASGARVVPAGFVRRWAALFIDQLVLVIPVIVFAVVVALALGINLDKTQSDIDPTVIVFYVLYFIAAPIYYAGLESSPWQATLGKRALGIKVTDLQGERLGFAHALGRWFAAALSYLTLYIGFLMAAVTERKRALHDYVAGTEVVDQWAYTDQPERQKEGLHGCLVVFLIAMLMVPIVAILAAISISQYQDYVIRSQVSEAAALADGVKVAIGEYVNNNSRFPESNADAGLPSPEQIHGAYAASVDIGAVPGRIDATFASHAPFRANAALNGKHLYFVGTIGAGSLVWRCASDDLKQKWCPSSCECGDQTGQDR